MIHPFRFGIQLDKPEPGMAWAQAAKRAEDRGDRWGFNHPVVQQDALEAFAPVVAQLHGT